MAGEFAPTADRRGQIDPAGRHYQGQRYDAARFGNDIFQNFYHFVKKRQPDAGGALDYAFESLALPELSPIDHAVCIRLGFSPLSYSPQVYVPTIAVPIAGLGGLVQGQMVMQPLYDNYNNTYAGTPP